MVSPCINSYVYEFKSGYISSGPSLSFLPKYIVATLLLFQLRNAPLNKGDRWDPPSPFVFMFDL